MPSYSMSWSLTRFTLSLRDPRILAAELAVQADRPLLARAVELEWPGWSGELDERQASAKGSRMWDRAVEQTMETTFRNGRGALIA